MIRVETLAIKRIALRMLASCELSFSSGSKGASIETPVRSISIGCVFFGINRSISRTCFGQRTLGRQGGGKFSQLFDRRQLAVEKEISDFLEVRLLRHLVNVVAAIHQAGVGIDPADFCFAGDHAGKSWAVGWFGFEYS